MHRRHQGPFLPVCRRNLGFPGSPQVSGHRKSRERRWLRSRSQIRPVFGVTDPKKFKNFKKKIENFVFLEFSADHFGAIGVSKLARNRVFTISGPRRSHSPLWGCCGNYSPRPLESGKGPRRPLSFPRAARGPSRPAGRSTLVSRERAGAHGVARGGRRPGESRGGGRPRRAFRRKGGGPPFPPEQFKSPRK